MSPTKAYWASDPGCVCALVAEFPIPSRHNPFGLPIVGGSGEMVPGFSLFSGILAS